MSSAAGSYDVSRLAFGSVLSAVALVLAIASSTSLWPPSTAGIYCTTLSLLYGIIMFASSYVEEEQHFWYWATSAWFLVLAVKRCVTIATSLPLTDSCLVRRQLATMDTRQGKRG